MFMWSGNDLRESFLNYFEGKGHLRVPSASLIPDDPTVLLTIAGMVPFKPYFVGKAQPPALRMTSSQKCVRTNDLDNVGRTARHHTFFEMLGNFSVGDYFKQGVIPWAWEYLTNNLNLDKDRLWISVYQDDDDAFKIWNQEVGIPSARIVRMGKEDNFWEMGATGPCGPCSEIYYDFGPEKGCASPTCAVGCDCDRYLEIWNLVFMEFDRDESGKLTPLPQQNIDTGMGLERIASVMQNAKTNFDTDLLRPLVGRMEDIAQIGYDCGNAANDMAFRVIADHLRSIVFLIGDGVLPGNEGRGYVLRRIMRRAMRYGKLLGVDEPFMGQVGARCSEVMRVAYPELGERREHILRVITAEEDRFNGTLHSGLSILQEIVEKNHAHNKLQISGDEAFKLYDTYGFPLEMTIEIAQEEGLSIDEAGFQRAMQGQKDRARSARESGSAENGNLRNSRIDKNIAPTVFIGREELAQESAIQAILAEDASISDAVAGMTVGVVVSSTPFYAESGGQVGDAGKAEWDGGWGEIIDTFKHSGDRFIHVLKIIEGKLTVGDIALLRVDERRRNRIASAHTATHLLHHSLREVLGDHVHQAGSLVQPDSLRFDFTHFEAVSSEQLEQIEEMVNELIFQDIPVATQEMEIDEAKKSGAMALFDEKYGDRVRVVSVGGISVELCGGIHLQQTGKIGLFKITSEGSVGAGLRRIEATVGLTAFQSYKTKDKILQEVCLRLKTKEEDVLERLEHLAGQLRHTEKELEKATAQLAGNKAQDVLSQIREIGGLNFLAVEVEASDMDALRITMDKLKDKTDVLLLAAAADGRANLIASCSKEAIAKGVKAGDIIKAAAKEVGGGGGGRPDMAQAGGKNPEGINAALAIALKTVESVLSSC
jgi:alanyl-tRNA synthetase